MYMYNNHCTCIGVPVCYLIKQRGTLTAGRLSVNITPPIGRKHSEDHTLCVKQLPSFQGHGVARIV